MKQDFIERNFFAVFKTLQVIFVIFACVEAAVHHWVGVASNLLFAVCIETFIKAEQSSRKVSKKVEVLYTWNKVKGEEDEDEDEDEADNSENHNLATDHCRYEEINLAGRTIRIPHKCDFCPNETANCKKIYIYGDSEAVCVV